MNNKEKVLILGGEGFIGRNIADILSSGFECYSVGNTRSFFPERNDVYIEKNPYKDLIDDKFDTYIHLIDNQVDVDVFTEAEKQLMENLSIDKSSHLVVFSSAVVYANPESPYGKRKLLLENFYTEYCEKNQINLTIVRLFNIYGKYQLPYRQGSLLANIFFNHINGLPIEINDLGSQRDFIYAEDMARIVEYIITNKFYGKSDLATGTLVSIGEIIDVIKDSIADDLEVVNKNVKDQIVSPSGETDLSKNVKLAKIKDSLKMTYSFYKENNQLIKAKLNI